MTLTTQVTTESLTVAKYFVSALGGCIEMQSLGVDSLVDLRGQTVAITGVGSEDVGIATLNVSQTETGGVIGLSVQGEGAAINLQAVPLAGDVFSVINLGIESVGMSFLTEGSGGSIGIGMSAMSFSFGNPAAGPSITLTPVAIIFKVGETIMTMTAEGIVTTAPTVEINCDDTNLVYSAEGITEEVGEVTREVTAEGHNFTAGEVELNVGVEGMMAEAPTNTAEFEGSSEMNSALITEAADAMLSVEAAISMVE